MPSALLFANLAPNAEKNSLLAVLPGDHVFGKRERMKQWIADGNSAEDWPRSFSVVFVSDREPEELSSLLEGYTFTQPDPASDDWIELFNTGEMTRTFAELEQYING